MRTASAPGPNRLRAIARRTTDPRVKISAPRVTEAGPAVVSPLATSPDTYEAVPGQAPVPGAPGGGTFFPPTLSDWVDLAGRIRDIARPGKKPKGAIPADPAEDPAAQPIGTPINGGSSPQYGSSTGFRFSWTVLAIAAAVALAVYVFTKSLLWTLAALAAAYFGVSHFLNAI